ncbi:MAG: helix-turn-helix transcriptional regulator [Bacteroidota bacterium]
MKLIQFDTQQGIYYFELSRFSTEMHRHPAVEIILAHQGHFTLSTPTATQTDLSFAIVPANVDHRVGTEEGLVHVLMIEHHNRWIKDFLNQKDIDYSENLYFEKSGHRPVIFLSDLLQQFSTVHLPREYDERVEQCLAIFAQQLMTYENMLETLTTRVFLSESRLSHLFKANVGVSLKKYLIWCRLKMVAQQILEKGENLSEAAISSGFYDQAHLSKAFKEILGLSPSKVYNSQLSRE